MEIRDIIGDYEGFFSGLLTRLSKVGINPNGLPIVQLCYRTTTTPEYELMRTQLKEFCSEFSETQFNGRSVAILNLRKPLILSRHFTASTIELPAPRAEHTYPSGLESLGILVKNSPSSISNTKMY